MWKFPYSCVLHWSRTCLGYHPRVTLPEENPLVWEPPPLQQNALSLVDEKISAFVWLPPDTFKFFYGRLKLFRTTNS